jgi:hypothetical protein
VRALHTIVASLCLLLLGAHLFRAGVPFVPLIIALVLAIVLLALRRPWAARTVQILLVAGALEWARTAIVLASRRAEMNEPYARLLVIIGSVAVVTSLAALGFQGKSVARAHGLAPRSGDGD